MDTESAQQVADTQRALGKGGSSDVSRREGPRMTLFQERGLVEERAGLALNKERLSGQ